MGYCKILNTAPVLPWWPRGEVSACNTGDVGSIPGRQCPLEKEPTQVYLPEKSHEQRSLAGCSPESDLGSPESDTT